MYNYIELHMCTRPTTASQDSSSGCMINEFAVGPSVTSSMSGYYKIKEYCDFHVTFLDYVNCLTPYLSYVSFPHGVNPPSVFYYSNNNG